MAKLSSVIIVAVFMALLLGNEGKSIDKRGTIQVVQTNDMFGWLCQNVPANSGFNWCALTTKPPTVPTTTARTTTTTCETSSSSTTEEVEETTSTKSTSTTEEDTTSTQSSSTTEDTTTKSSSTTKTTSLNTISVSLPSALERAHWCQFSNGSFVPLGLVFTYTTCLICQCSQSHAIVCNSLQCQPTYCEDGSKPVYKNDQCCPHCNPRPPTSCVYGGISFPQGSIIKSTADDIQCWCQAGSIECRRITPITTTRPSIATTYSAYFSGNNTSLYIIIVIVCVLLIFGSLLCCGGAIIYYYYFYIPSQQAEQAYDQYYTSAGWQPMGEDGQIVDPSVLEKQAEAENSQQNQNYPTGHSQEYIPPPYAVYNGAYTSGPVEKS